MERSLPDKVRGTVFNFPLFYLSLSLGWSHRDDSHGGHLPVSPGQAHAEGLLSPGERLCSCGRPAGGGEGVCERLAAVPEPVGHGALQHLWPPGAGPCQVAETTSGCQVNITVLPYFLSLSFGVGGGLLKVEIIIVNLSRMLKTVLCREVKSSFKTMCI